MPLEWTRRSVAGKLYYYYLTKLYNNMKSKIMFCVATLLLILVLSAVSTQEGFSTEEKDALKDRAAAKSLFDESEKKWQKMVTDGTPSS